MGLIIPKVCCLCNRKLAEMEDIGYEDLGEAICKKCTDMIKEEDDFGEMA